MNVLYERREDIPGGVPLVMDEAPSGDIRVLIRADLITEAGCVLLTRSANELARDRQLTPPRQYATT